MVKISPDWSLPREIPNCDSPHMKGSPHCPYEKADPPLALKNESPHLHGGEGGERGYHVISSYQPTLLGILLSCVSWYSECYLDTIFYLEKWLFSGARLVAWLETLVLSESVVSFNIFYSCHFGIFLIWLSKKRFLL